MRRRRHKRSLSRYGRDWPKDKKGHAKASKKGWSHTARTSTLKGRKLKRLPKSWYPKHYTPSGHRRKRALRSLRDASYDMPTDRYGRDASWSRGGGGSSYGERDHGSYGAGSGGRSMSGAYGERDDARRSPSEGRDRRRRRKASGSRKRRFAYGGASAHTHRHRAHRARSSSRYDHDSSGYGDSFGRDAGYGMDGYGRDVSPRGRRMVAKTGFLHGKYHPLNRGGGRKRRASGGGGKKRGRGIKRSASRGRRATYPQYGNRRGFGAGGAGPSYAIVVHRSSPSATRHKRKSRYGSLQNWQRLKKAGKLHSRDSSYGSSSYDRDESYGRDRRRSRRSRRHGSSHRSHSSSHRYF